MSQDRGLPRLVFAVHLLAVCLAVGAPVFFAAAVAPAAFRVLPSRALAGDLTGAILSRLCGVLEGCYAVLFATTWHLTREHRKSRVVVVLRRLPILAFFSALTTGALIVPAAERVRRSLPAGLDISAAAPLLRQRFDRLHRLSVSLLLLEIACGVALLAAAAAFSPAGDGHPPQPPRLPAS